MKLLVIFIVCNIINVIIQTVKSIVTVKCSKTPAAIVNALAYGFYTYIVILMVCELPMIWKCIIVGLCNLVGVFVVKWIEEKARKDKLWRIEVTIPHNEFEMLVGDCEENNITSYNYIDIEKYYICNFYSETQEESKKIKEILKKYNAKYFVTESKTL